MSTPPVTTIPLVLKEVLFSKMAHDIASPAGATENGLELLEEGSMMDDALALVQQSAQSVSGRLRYYRLCYGTASGCAGLTADALKQQVLTFFRFEQKVNLAFGDTTDALADSHKKLLLNMVLCAADSIPYGGTIHLSWQPAMLKVTATHTNTTKPIKEEACRVYQGEAIPETAISPYTVQAWFTGYYAWQQGVQLQKSLPSAGSFALEAKLPSAA